MSKNTHTITIKAITAQAKDAIKSVQNSVDDMISTIERNRDGIQSLGIMSGVAFAGLGMGIKSAVSTFADFEATMSGVKAVLKPTEEEFKKLTEQAEILGATTKFSALETAQGTEMLARNGLNAQQILGGALEATLNLAAATGTDIATAADIATDAMASFGLQTENLGQVMNSITGVTNASKFAIEDYKYALAAGGGVAAALGVELEDFNTVIAATSSRFAGGSDAGTSFKTFMQRLVPQSKEATKEMQKLGLMTENGANQFYDAIGKLKSMAEVSEILKEATKDLSEEQKNASLSVIFGSDALRTAMGLAEVGAEKFHELQKTIEGTDASENAKTRMDNLKGTFEELGGAVDSVKIALGRSLAPVIKQVTIFFQDIAQKIGVWVAKNPELASTIMMVATAVTGIIAVMAGLALAIGPIISGISLLGKIIAFVIPSFTTIISVIKAVGVAISFLASPIGIIIALIVGLVAVIFFNWDLIKNFTIETFESIKNFLSETFENIKNIGGEFIYNFVEQFVILGESIKTTVVNVWNGIVGFFVGIWESIKSGVSNFGETIKNIWSNIWNGVSDIGGNILNSITGFIGNTWENIKNGVSNFGENIKNKWSSIWGKIKETGGNLLSNIGNGVKNTFTGITDWIGGVFGIDLTGAFSNSFEKAKESTIGIVTGMVDKIKGILDGIKNFIGGIVNSITGAGEEANRVQASVRSNSGSSGTGARASGGPVTAGSRYMVGERGPELFVPNTSGYIVPNNQLGSSATININMGGIVVTNEADENRLVQKITQKLQKEAKLYKLGIV